MGRTSLLRPRQGALPPWRRIAVDLDIEEEIGYSRRVNEVSKWVEEPRRGEPGALDELVPQLYEELRRVARGHLRGERQNLTLATTALVHEAYLKLRQQRKIETTDRTRFLETCLSEGSTDPYRQRPPERARLGEVWYLALF